MASVAVRLTDLLQAAERLIAGRVKRILDTCDLSIDQWRVLHLLSDGAGHPMTTVARDAMVPAPSLTKIVDKLVERGLVYRKIDESDRRKVLIFISAHGDEVYHRVDAAVLQEELSIIGQLETGDGAQLLAFLDRVVARLN